VEGLGRSRKLKSLTFDGNEKDLKSLPMSRAVGVKLGKEAFGNLVALDVAGIATIDDMMLRTIVRTAGKLTSLSVRNCSSITLSATRKLLISYGYKLQHLSLEILKAQSLGHSSIHSREDEHLCPVIRDCCSRLKMLDLYTNKICNEVLFPSMDNRSGNGAMTGGLPTPPASPDLVPAMVAGIPGIPTPPAESTTLDIGISAPMLPSPLFNFSNTAIGHNSWVEENQNEQKREMMRSVSLRIPYDASCFGAGSGGPTLQQTFTSLCDGMPAKELLEFGQKAFEEGLVELVKIRGHWKGGPYLIMKNRF